MNRFVLSVLSVSICCAGESLRSGFVKIVPELTPKSHKTFFEHDYPNDNRPIAVHEFRLPYPSLQSNGDYDKDYVKDENSDRGEWDAQMAYDNLRDKMHAAQEDVKRAEQKRDEAQEALDHFWKEDHKVDANSEAHGAAAEDAARDAKDAAEQVKHVGREVVDATDDLNKEVKDVKNCEEQLLKARKALETLTQEVAAAREKRKLAEEAISKAKSAAAESALRERELSAKASQEQATFEGAEEKYEEKEDQIDNLKAKLKKAEADLRRIRERGSTEGMEPSSTKSGSGRDSVPHMFMVALLVSFL